MRKTMKKSSASKRTQKLWKMKGCAKSRRNLGGKRGGSWGKKTGGKKGKSRKQRGGNCGCGLQLGGGCRCGLQLGGAQKGGCSSCLSGGVQMGGRAGVQMGGRAGVQMGGRAGGINYGGPALVGAPWSGKIADWPGVSGKDGQTNFFSLNEYKSVDPQTSMISERDQQTFMKGGRRLRNKRGGGVVPQDLVNLGRSMVYGLGSAYNTLNGYASPANPLPYKDQLVDSPTRNALKY